MSFPYLRVAGGALLVVAGLAAYSGLSVGASGALILVFGGAVVLMLALLGHRPRAWDAAVFIVGLLALSAVSTGYSFGPRSVTYSATRTQLRYNTLSFTVVSSTGSVSLGFTNRPNLAYQVNFSTAGGIETPGVNTVTNSTAGGVFNLKVSSTWSSVSVLVGRGFSLDFNVTTGTGSIDLEAPGAEAIRSVSLYSSIGSVNAVVDSSALTALILRADFGSINLVSHHLGAAGARVPVTLSGTTGSVHMSVELARPDAVSLTASTAIGSISQSLSGFNISQNTRTDLAATAGDLASAENSFVVTASSSLGSVDVTAGFVPG